MSETPILCALLDIFGFMMDIMFSIIASSQQVPLPIFGSPSDILGIFGSFLGCSAPVIAA